MSKRTPAPIAKPILYLTGPATGSPTLNDLIRMTEALTGKTPSPEAIAEMKETLETS